MGLLLLIAAVLLPEIHAATGTCGHAMQGQQLAALGYVGRWNSGTATPNIQEFLKAAGNVAEYTSQNPAELFWAVQGADSAANYGTLVAVCAVNVIHSFPRRHGNLTGSCSPPRRTRSLSMLAAQVLSPSQDSKFERDLKSVPRVPAVPVRKLHKARAARVHIVQPWKLRCVPSVGRVGVFESVCASEREPPVQHLNAGAMRRIAWSLVSSHPELRPTAGRPEPAARQLRGRSVLLQESDHSGGGEGWHWHKWTLHGIFIFGRGQEAPLNRPS
eukprot:TRINITY_DN3313_c0_g2_i1.p1 TRINITY_DN3313_c0_g2~~TRINITY_DN3313_c0_g2_i1.p1  ORF type:complete len:273 (+),score=11.74 TRINITY_DN3313_c0_g2_i1:119-937(+)